MEICLSEKNNVHIKCTYLDGENFKQKKRNSNRINQLLYIWKIKDSNSQLKKEKVVETIHPTDIEKDGTFLQENLF